jgi:hypothetical protein
LVQTIASAGPLRPTCPRASTKCPSLSRPPGGRPPDGTPARRAEDALIDAGAKQEKADKAAEELAGYENRLANIDTRLTLLTWMVGTNIVITLGVLWRLLAH